jgi:leucyl aminopeptidase
MDIRIVTTVSPEKYKTAAVVVGVFEPRKLAPQAARLDKSLGGTIGALCRAGDMEGKPGKCAMLRPIQGALASRVLVVGLGKEADFNAKSYRETLLMALKALADTGAQEAVVDLPVPKGQSDAWCVHTAALIAGELDYKYDLTFGTGRAKTDKPKANQTVSIAVNPADEALARTALARGRATAAGVAFTKTLGNLPANICTPTYLANEAKSLAKLGGITCNVLERAACEKLKMGSFLSVAAGSRQPPKFIVLEYWGAGKKVKPTVLVGKGVTFDTGGISLKPGEGMDEMKFDMCGAASVLGTFKTLSLLKPKLNVVGLVPATENMPGGLATKPGDVVTSMSGQTIEILNTDAEGRLILCDALTYAERYEPQAVVDIATLTGACVIALGGVATGLFANDDALADALLSAGQTAHDRAWRMPLWDDYQEQLKSNFADMANIGGRPAGSVTAACFLSRFTKKYKWAHLDIAGTAWKSGAAKGATGRPVPLLVEFLLRDA